MPDNHYKDFDENDFLQDEFFLEWMQRKHEDTNKWWTKWLAENKDKHRTIKSAQQKYKLILSFKKYQITDKEEKQVWKSIAKRISYPQKKTFDIQSFRWLAAAAACIALVVSVALYKYYTTGTEYITTAASGVRKLTLDDGSHIILNKGASLKRYSNVKRQVWLEGEAYFEVNKAKNIFKNPLPFVVHARNFDVNVTGTSFLVKSSQNSKSVVLTEGRVSIYNKGKYAEMKPGDRIVLKDDRFIREHVNPMLYTAWKDDEFKFNNTSLIELKTLVSNIYGLELIVNNEQKLQYHAINGVINISSKESFIKTIEVLLDANVNTNKNQLIISPKTHQ